MFFELWIVSKYLWFGCKTVLKRVEDTIFMETEKQR